MAFQACIRGDGDPSRLLPVDGDRYATVRPEFEVALSVLTTVVSKTDENWIVVGTGLESMSCSLPLHLNATILDHNCPFVY